MRYEGLLKSSMLLVFIIILSLVFLDCASTAKYERVLNSWVGRDINRVIERWGPPSNEYTMPNDNKMYTWLFVGGTLVTSNYNDFLNLAISRSVTYYCKTTFTTNPEGVIMSWQWQGNACRIK